jgi:hypothetical protein
VRNPKTETPTRTPKVFIEDRSRNLSSTSILTKQFAGNPKTARGPPGSDVLAGVEPAFLSIKAAAAFMAESQWSIKYRLRLGQLRARKSGRRTLVEFASLKEFIATLPVATFAPAPPRKREITVAK